jgi:hypothetical protein
MPYARFEPPHGNLSFGWVSIAAHSSGYKTPYVTVSIAEDVAINLGLECGNLVSLEVGTGDDAGWLRMRKSDNGGGLAVGGTGGNGKKKSLRFRVGGTAFGVHERHAAVTRQPHEVFLDRDNRGPHITFELPEWCHPSKHIIEATAARNSKHG